jgi:HSP20 family protein
MNINLSDIHLKIEDKNLPEEWWMNRKKQWPWLDLLEEINRMEKMIDEIMKHSIKTVDKEKIKNYGPYIYGFSVVLNSNGKPRIQEFGNVHPTMYGPQFRIEREPLIDIVEEKNHVSIVAELPGVKKEDINLYSTENVLHISVNTHQRKYIKNLNLPVEVDPKSAKAFFKNGVLTITLKKKIKKYIKKAIIKNN